MLGYVTLGANDLPRAVEFYDAIASEFGIKRSLETDRGIVWSEPGAGAGIGIVKPFDGKAASVGNGVMAALAAKDRAQVDRVYKLALSMGGVDEGPPGDRGGGFYAAYFRDRDGNKLNVYCTG